MNNSVQVYATRLKPGEDLKQGIEKLVKENNIQAGWVSACVGSLTHYNIRFANQPNGAADTGHFEILSVNGTVSVNGSHLHISVSDSTGRCIGGHMLDQNVVYTTAEIVISSSPAHQFTRENDGSTAWPELKVRERSEK